MSIAKKVALLSIADDKTAYHVLKELIVLSETSDQVYRYFDTFVEMMNSSDSYIRSRSLRLIAFNTKWDTDKKMNLMIDDYLKHIEDEKPITSRQCIKDTYIIAQNKPELIEAILEALHKFNKFYNETMQSLIYKDRQEAIRKISQLIQ